MDDLISRQAAMDEMSKQQTYKMFVGEDTVYLDANDVGSVLASLPSIDAVPVKHGRWIPQKGGGYCCSECGSYSLDEVDGAFVHVSARTQFCHHCGARMDERKES